MTDDRPQETPDGVAPQADAPPAEAPAPTDADQWHPGDEDGGGPAGGRDLPGDAESPFSLAGLRTLFKLMDRFDVGEVNLRNGDERWQVRRGAVPFAPAPGSAAPAPPPAAAAPPPASPEGGGASGAAAAKADGLTINSPTVGTFYEAASPEDPPLTAVGQRVEPDTVVCLVEAMKVFNQIEAEVSGVIAEVLVRNGEAVEYGQPLFRVTPG